jgi:hypothetical protein
MGVPLMDVSLIGVPLMGVPLIGVHFIGVLSRERVCHGRLISIVAITGIAVKGQKERIRCVD